MLSARSLSLLRPTIRTQGSELWASWNGLQLPLMRALESRARHNGWSAVVSDTTDNIPTANNFINAGYRLCQPPSPWAWPNTLYWRKSIR
jgi:phage terminase large subunit